MPGTHVAFTDSFDRANEGPPPSASWTNSPGGAMGSANMAVVSNALTQFDAAGSFRSGCYWNVADFGPDVEVGFRVGAWQNTTNNGFGLGARLVDIGAGTSDGYAMFLDRTATDVMWGIQRVDNGVGTGIGTAVAQAIAAGDWIAFRIVGSGLSAWYSSQGGVWTQIRSETDATYTAAGKVCLQVTNNQEPRIDDFWALTVPPDETKILRPVSTPLRF